MDPVNIPQLTHDELIRLECLSKAILVFNSSSVIKTDQYINMARRFESYVKGNDKKDGLE